MKFSRPKITIKDPLTSEEFLTSGEIEFKDVCFKYPDADEFVLKNISFKVEKGPNSRRYWFDW